MRKDQLLQEKFLVKFFIPNHLKNNDELLVLSRSFSHYLEFNLYLICTLYIVTH